MSDVGWGSDHLEPPKKRVIPLWVMGCAGGCMFAIGAAAVATYYGGTMLKEWWEVQSKPEVQWPALAAVLPFDEQPAGFTIARWPIMDLWQLEDRDQDLLVYVFGAPQGGSGKTWGEWLSSPKQSVMFKLQDGEFDTEEGHLILQGRELRCVRFTRTELPEAPAIPALPDPAQVSPAPTSPPLPDEPPESLHVEPNLDLAPAFARFKQIRGDGIALDVTAEGSHRRVLVWLVRGTQGTTVSDEAAMAILAPFKIGPAH